tara:strand:+ start:1108 stop:1260 length:153 start_codon:yes stop_codon:yes gene_type:complete
MKTFLYFFLILPSIIYAHAEGNLVHFHFEGTLILLIFAFLVLKNLWRNNK